MPNYVPGCEDCAGYEPFLVHEDELLENGRRNPFERYCPRPKRISFSLPIGSDVL
jgi:hypothetical protein